MTPAAPGTLPTSEQASQRFRFRRAFERHRDAIAAIKEEDLETINLDIRAAVVVSLGAYEAVQELLPEMDAKLREYDRASVVELDDRARASGYAHTLYLAASAPVERIPEYVAKLRPVRATFLSDIRTLQKRNIIDAQKLANIKEGQLSHSDLAFDVMLLAEILREQWAGIEGKTAVTIAELDRAEHDADELSTALAIKEGGPSVATEAAKTRHRAYTYSSTRTTTFAGS